MTNEEKFEFLENIRLENDFYPIDEGDCREKNAALIENMETIFDLKDSSDYTCFFALAELMADEDKIDAIKKHLLEESPFDGEIKQPDRETKLLVTTALEDNPLFFSMAWNWVVFCEYQVKRNLAEKFEVNDESDNWMESPFAASTGSSKFGERILEGTGILFIDCQEDYSRFRVGLKLEEPLIGKKLSFTQKIRIKDSGKELDVLLKTNGQPQIYSEPFAFSEYGNPSNGFRYIGELKMHKDE